MSEPRWQANAEAKWKEQWEEYLGHVRHRDCQGKVEFSAPDSEGTPTLARCLFCRAVWRKAYGWQQERLTGLHKPGLPDPPNLRPEDDVLHPAKAVFQGSVDPLVWQAAIKGWRLSGAEDLLVCWEDTAGALVDIHFNCRIKVPDPRDRHLDLVLEPTPEFLALTDPKEARAALSTHLGILGDLAWAAWQKAHSAGDE